MNFLVFLTFWQNFLSFRRSGELYGLKSKKQIIVVSLILVLGFGELIWSISFLSFSFFILGGIIAVIFGIVLDIYKEYFKPLPNGLAVANGKKFDKILLRDIVAGTILIMIFILISPWFLPKTY